VRSTVPAVAPAGRCRCATSGTATSCSASLDDDNVPVLRAHRARQAAEPLAASTAWAGEDRNFCREDGDGLDPDRVSAPFRKLCETAGVRRVELHDTRHAMATLMLAAGIRVEVVSKRTRSGQDQRDLRQGHPPRRRAATGGSAHLGRLVADGRET
jgi:hypothetical protein